MIADFFKEYFDVLDSLAGVKWLKNMGANKFVIHNLLLLFDIQTNNLVHSDQGYDQRPIPTKY